MDMNDNPPKFEQISYSCVLSQHAQRGQFVTLVSASDPDVIDQNNLLYAIAEGNELQTYYVESITGVLTLMNIQNFAEKHLTVLNISVTDGVYTSFARVEINISPANLHNPKFTHMVYDVKINENQMAGRLVVTVSRVYSGPNAAVVVSNETYCFIRCFQVNAVDDDFGEYGDVTYDIFSDEMKEYFAIDKVKGEIITKIKLDREMRKVYEVPVIGTDRGGRNGFAIVKIKVGDINDNAPEFELAEYKTSIHGNLSLNTTFLNVSGMAKIELSFPCG